MDTATLAHTILTHPLTWGAVTLAAAPLAGWIVNLQLHAVGLAPRTPHRAGIAWNLAISFLVSWLVLALGLGAVAGHADLTTLETNLFSIFQALVGLLPAALILMGAEHHRRVRLDEAREHGKDQLERTQGELRWLGYGAGTLAAVALLDGPVLVPLLLIGAAASALWWLFSPGARGRTRAWRDAWVAGTRLRASLVRGQCLTGQDGRLTQVEDIGILGSEVIEDGQRRTLSNTELLERLDAAGSRGGSRSHP